VKSVGPHPEHTSLEHDVHKSDHDHGRPVSWREINRVLFVAAAAGGGICFLHGGSNPHTTVIGVACTLLGGFPIFHEAYKNIRQRRMPME
jgi:hypothetical protein